MCINAPGGTRSQVAPSSRARDPASFADSVRLSSLLPAMQTHTEKAQHKAGLFRMVHPEGLEPPTSDPKSDMISISLRVQCA